MRQVMWGLPAADTLMQGPMACGLPGQLQLLSAASLDRKAMGGADGAAPPEQHVPWHAIQVNHLHPPQRVLWCWHNLLERMPGPCSSQNFTARTAQSAGKGCHLDRATLVHDRQLKHSLLPSCDLAQSEVLLLCA